MRKTAEEYENETLTETMIIATVLKLELTT